MGKKQRILPKHKVNYAGRGCLHGVYDLRCFNWAQPLKFNSDKMNYKRQLIAIACLYSLLYKHEYPEENIANIYGNSPNKPHADSQTEPNINKNQSNIHFLLAAPMIYDGNEHRIWWKHYLFASFFMCFKRVIIDLADVYTQPTFPFHLGRN